MGEVDTKPFKSVQTAITLFAPQRSLRADSKQKAGESEEVGINRKRIAWHDEETEFTNEELKSQRMLLKITEDCHMETLLQIEVYNAMFKDLSTQLSKSETGRENYIVEFTAAETQVELLKSKNKHLKDDLLQYRTTNEGLQRSIIRLRFIREEMKLELKASEEARLLALKQVEEFEEAVSLEKMKIEELMRYANELNDAVLASNFTAIESEKDKTTCLSAKDEELKIAQNELEELRAYLNLLRDQLKDEQTANSDLIESLQLELKQSKEQASIAIQGTNQLKQEMELIGEQIELNEVYIHSIKSEMAAKQETSQKLKEENESLNNLIDSTSNEIKTLKEEMGLVEQREFEAQTEIAILKAELHQSRAKIASLEAAEARGQYIKSGLYLAVQELAKEAEEAKKRLRENVEGPTITISIDEYEWLVKQANNPEPVELDPSHETPWAAGEDIELELVAAKEEIKRLRSDVEETKKRAEEAEEAKRAVEEKMRKYREHKQKRRDAMAALKEESIRWVNKPSSAPDTTTGSHKPLGKVLKMKF